jgi:hypothetical protein
MLLGRRPKTAADHQLIPTPFAALIATCTRPNADARYVSGSALLKALSEESPGADSMRSVGLLDRRSADGGGQADHDPAAGSPRWWWEFHQAAAAVVYGVTTWPAWIGRQIIGGTTGRALFIAVLVAVIASVILRLHLWFTSRFYPGELHWARRRAGTWIRLADWLFVVAIGATGSLVGDDLSPVAVGLTAVAVGAAIAFLVIEPATARAAFAGGTPEGVPYARR